jgi:hypothetical protein
MLPSLSSTVMTKLGCPAIRLLNISLLWTFDEKIKFAVNRSLTAFLMRSNSGGSCYFCLISCTAVLTMLVGSNVLSSVKFSVANAMILS